MHAISIRRTWFAFVLSLIFMGVGAAEGRAVGWSGARGAEPSGGSARWLTNYATVFANGGLGWLTTKVDETVQTTGDFIGWGTGVHTAVVTDTALNTEDTGGSPAYGRVTATRSVVTVTKTNDAIQWVGSITSNGTKSITEAANFTASTSGTMLVYGDFTAIVLALNDIIQFTIKMQFTN